MIAVQMQRNFIHILEPVYFSLDKYALMSKSPISFWVLAGSVVTMASANLSLGIVCICKKVKEGLSTEFLQVLL